MNVEKPNGKGHRKNERVKKEKGKEKKKKKIELVEVGHSNAERIVV